MLEIFIDFNDNKFSIDLSEEIDISIPLDPNVGGPKCFYAPDLKIEPVVGDDFIGDISLGGPVNFKNIFINPHGNGTHTECVGHIMAGDFYISDVLTQSHYISQLVTVLPSQVGASDTCIMLSDLPDTMPNIEAIIIRTLPNLPDKLTKDYSDTNPCYIHHEAIKNLSQRGIKHLLIDIPSVDREVDGACFLGHKAWWGVDTGDIDFHKTITELVYVDNEINDGLYLCSIQTLPIKMDASPSSVKLYILTSKV
jgi:arylformamidase